MFEYPKGIIDRAVKAWSVSAAVAAEMLDYQESRELETSEGEVGFWTQTDNGPVWREAVDTME